MKIEFYPEHGGNLEKDEKDRVSIEIETMTVEEMDSVKAQVSMSKVKGFRDKFKSNEQEVLNDLFSRRFLSAKNLNCPMTKKPVKTAKDFSRSYCSIELKMEILDTIQDVSQLSEKQIKNSGPQSVGA